MNFELSRDESDFLESLRAEGQTTSGSCSSCGGKGSWLNTDGKAVLCSCLKEQMWRDKYITAGVPPKYFGKTLSENWNLKQDPWGNNLTQAALAKKIKIKSVMDKYINALPALCAGRPIKIIPNRGTTINLLSLLLVGGQWSGKSLICSALAQEAVRKKLTVAYYDYADLYADLSGFDNRDKQSDYAEEFATKDLIIIDGITHYEIRNPTLGIQLDRIGRSRIKSGKPIVLSAYDGYDKIDAGPGWSSMTSSCFKITLPTPMPPQPFAS